MLNSKQSVKLNAQALETLQGLVSEKAYLAVRRKRQSGLAAKVLMDLGLMAENPYETIAKVSKGEEFRVSEETHSEILTWLANSKVGLSYRKEAATIEIPVNLFAPVGKVTVSQIEGLLEEMGYTKANGLWDIASHKFDLVNFQVNGDQLTYGSIALTPTGKVVALDQSTTMYVVVSLVTRAALADGASVMEAGSVREMLQDLTGLFSSQKVGTSDELRKELEQQKSAVIPLFFDRYGYGLMKTPVGDKALLYAKIAKQIPGMGAHPQGKYWVTFAGTGIHICAQDEYAKEALNSKALSVLGLDEGSPLNAKVIVGSTDLPKWFKRLTVGMLQAARLLSPDVGYMTVNGAKQEGKRTPVLVVMGGISLPYLGSSIALASRKEVGQHLAHYRERFYRERWVGELAVTGPAVGTRVAKGDVLAEGGQSRIVCKRDGVVLSTSSLTVNGETLVSINVGTVDKTGQVKPRSMGGAKESLTHVDWTNPDWNYVFKALNLSGEALICGDVAVFGLKDGDKPMFLRGEDTNKGTGKGGAMSEVNLAAETLKKPIDYNVKAHFDGVFDEVLEEFETTAYRRVVIPHSVDAETFDLVAQAVEAGIAHPGLTLHTIRLEDGRILYIVLQEADAYMAYDLVKVESLPVADNLTTQRVPGELAVSANAFGMPHLAQDLIRRGSDQRAEYVALQRATWATAVAYADRTDKVQLTYQSGVQEDAYLVDLNAPLVVRNRLQQLSEEGQLSGLKQKMVIARIDPADGQPEFANGGEHLSVVIDPVVINAFGGGEDESSIETLTRQLCWMVANEGDPAEVNRTILRLKGAMRTASNAAKVAKRVTRGAVAVSARTRPGYVPSGWTAVSYWGNAAKMTAKAAGWTADRNEDGSYVNGHPGDWIMGLDAVMNRNPQVNPTPQRLFCPDAPVDVIEVAKAMGNYPEGFGRYGLLTGNTLEPDVFIISPLATAADNGDHDGDSRVVTPNTDPESVEEARAFDWRAHRLSVINFYMKEVQDPAVYAFEHKAAKLKWARPVMKTLADLVWLTRRSIENQTTQIGSAYNHAHAALVISDLFSSKDTAAKAQGLMFGHYEEQLAGLNDTYYEFYTTLGKQRDLGLKWEPTMRALSLKLNHSVGDPEKGTKGDWDTFKTINQMVAGCSFIERKGDVPGTFRLADGNLNTIKIRNAVLTGLFRDLTSGNLGSPLFKWALQMGFVDMIRQQSKTSITAQYVVGFIDEVMPEVNLDRFGNGGYSDFIL